MKISTQWLYELCDVNEPAEAIAEKLTAAGFEVESIHNNRPHLRHFIVAQALQVAPHPNASNLSVVTLLDGEGTRDIVCGAQHIPINEKLVLALPGAQIDGKNIVTTEIRGIRSSGMLCSEAELGISCDKDGLCLLPADWQIGKRLDYTSLADTILDINVTPNRPDGLSHIGIAREVAALFGGRLKKPRFVLREEGGEINDKISIELLDSQSCRRYQARLLQQVRVQKSPLPMRARLHALGIKAINNVVDITNWVMLELGVPLHAFDFEKIETDGHLKKKKIFIQKAKQGDTLIGLDGHSYILKEHDLVIASSSQQLALAGIMGGASCQITPQTTQVLLECAYFKSPVIYQTQKRLSLNTEAAQRHGKGIDLEMLTLASEHAAHLLCEQTNAKVCREFVDLYPKKRTIQEITAQPKIVNEFLGTDLTAEDIARILTPLEFIVKRKTEEAITFEIPSFRHDIQIEADVIEEVARIYGYDLIPTRLPDTGGVAQSFIGDLHFKTHLALAQKLIAQGLQEAIHYAFVSTQDESIFRPLYCTQAVEIKNPMSEQEAVMRTSLIPGLIQALKRNIVAQQHHVRIFENARVFIPRCEKESSHTSSATCLRASMLPNEENHLAALLYGQIAPLSWGATTRHYDFYDIKALLESIMQLFCIDFEISNITNQYPFMHPKASACISQKNQSRIIDIGFIGAIHPRIAAQYEIEEMIWVMDINLDKIQRTSHHQKLKSLAKFPAIKRDIAFFASREQPVGNIIESIEKQNIEHLEDIQLFDVYQGQSVPENQISYALSFTFRHPSRTLKEEEITPLFKKLIVHIKDQFNLTIRD